MKKGAIALTQGSQGTSLEKGAHAQEVVGVMTLLTTRGAVTSQRKGGDTFPEKVVGKGEDHQTIRIQNMMMASLADTKGGMDQGDTQDRQGRKVPEGPQGQRVEKETPGKGR